MEESLHYWRDRHYSLRLELLTLSKKIVDITDPVDLEFYQEICENYARHLKRIETECYAELGVNICNCKFFNPDQCR